MSYQRSDEDEAKDEAVFTNTYTAPSAADQSISAKKSFVPGRGTVAADLPSGEGLAGLFSFTLTAGDNTAGEGVETPMPRGAQGGELTVQNGGTAGTAIDFGSISYSKPGEYHYVINETGTSDTTGAWGTSGKTVNVTVTVTKSETSNRLVASAPVYEGGDDGANGFVNTYTKPQPITWAPWVAKALAGEGAPALKDVAGQFTFSISGDDAASAATLPEDAEATNAADGAVRFGDLMFAEPGEYRYTIVETGSANPSIAPSTHEVKLVVTVAAKDGKLVPTATYDGGDAVTVTNTYTVPAPVEQGFQIRKAVEGTGVPALSELAGKFHFTMAPASDNGQAPLPGNAADATNDESGTVTFDKVTFDEPGTYRYTITETGIDNNDGTWAAHTSQVDVTVTVSRPVTGAANQLTASVSYQVAGKDDATFTNTYTQPEDATFVPEVQKELSGSPLGLEDVAGAFTFQLAPAEGETAPMPGAEGDVAHDAADGTVRFGAITLTPDDSGHTYHYVISETGSSNPSFATSGQRVYLDLAVITQDGKLVATPTYRTAQNGEAVAGPTITNEYQTPADGTASIEATKAVQPGKDTSESDIPNYDGLFSFTLTAGDNTAGEGVGTPMPQGVEGGELTVKNAGTSVDFGSISYSQPGVYHYTIAETGSSDGTGVWGTSGKVVDVTVTVSRPTQGENRLVTSVSYTVNGTSDDATFTNTYSRPGATSYAPQVAKALDGTDLKPSDVSGQFSFQIAAADPTPDAPLPASTTARNNGATVQFGAIEFQTTGTFHYVITETGSDNPSFAKSDQKVELTVTVAPQNGVLVATPAYKVGGAVVADGQTATITNEFQQHDGTVVELGAHKSLVADAGGAYAPALAEGQFSFALYAGTDVVGDPLATVTNAADGSVSFGSVDIPASDFAALKAGDSKTYTYAIVEQADGDAATSTDTRHVTAAVTVTKQADGSLKAGDVTYAGGEGARHDGFVNTYSPVPSDGLSLPVSKVLTGRDWAEGETFGFAITPVSFQATEQDAPDVSDGALAAMPLPSQTTIRVGSAGGSFDGIAFKTPGIYTYQVRELTNPDDRDLSYTDVTYVVRITVADDGGKLVATPSYTPGLTDGSMAFENVRPEKTVSVDDAEAAAQARALVGQTLTYTVRYTNNQSAEATVTVTDVVPTGTELVEGSAGDGTFDAATKTLTWVVPHVGAGEGGTVSFKARVTEDALTIDQINNTAHVRIGDDGPTVDSNTVPVTTGRTGSLEVSKRVVASGDAPAGDVFTVTVTLRDAGGNALGCSYAYEGTGSVTGGSDGVVALGEGGTATLVLRDGESVTLAGLPEGASYEIAETVRPGGYEATYEGERGQVAADQTAHARVTNTFTPVAFDPAQAGVSVRKMFEGGSLAERQFAFEMSVAPKGEGADPDGFAPAVQSATSDGQGGVSFGPVTFTREGVYTVTVREKVPEAWDDVLYDTHVFTYDVRVTAEGGRLVATAENVSAANGGATFTNVKPHKSVTDVPADGVRVGDVLTYVIEWANTTDAPADVVVTDDLPEGLAYVAEGTEPAPATVEGSHVAWNLGTKEAGARGSVTLKARVTEDAPTVGDQITNSATIQVGDNPKVTTNGVPVDRPGTGSLSVTKIVVSASGGAADEGRVFDVTVTLKAADGAPLTGSGYAYAVDGDASQTLELDGAGTAVIRLAHGQTAVISGLPLGATYAVGEQVPAGYTATFDGSSGTVGPEASHATVTNTYGTTQKPQTVSTDALFTKDVEGRSWFATDVFTFTLRALTGGAPMPASATATVTPNLGADGSPEDGPVSFGFGTMTFDYDDIRDVEPDADGARTKTFVYEVTEDDPASTSITKDGHAATLTVTLTDDGQGNLSAVSSVEQPAFVNTFDAAVDYAATGGLQIAKTLTGRDMAEGQFAFTVTPQASDTASASDAAAQLGIDESGTTVASPAARDGETAVIDVPTASAASFTTADAGRTYVYRVSETRGGTPEASDATGGYTNDDATYLVSVTTSFDRASGILTVTTTATDEASGQVVDQRVSTSNHTLPGGARPGKVVVPFVNAYAAQPGYLGGDGYVRLQATKQLTGRPMVDGEFAFTVSLVEPDGTETQVASGTNAADGTISFDRIEYTTASLQADYAAGLAQRSDLDGGGYAYAYHYRVAESEHMDAGVIPLTGPQDVTVTVTDRTNGAPLEVSVAYPSGTEGITFVNEYGGEGRASVPVRGTKTLATAGDAATPDITGRFTFSITGVDEDGNPAPLPEATTATNAADGTVDFGTIGYTMESVFGDVAPHAADVPQATSAQRSKTFTYTVIESGSVPGVTNDATAQAGQSFTVTVTDNGDGTLSARSSSADGASFAFTNTYFSETPSGTGASVSATKVLSGRDLAAGEFSFELRTAKTGEVAATASNDAQGGVSFSKLAYDSAKLEALAAQGDATYDEASHAWTVSYVASEVDGGKAGVSYDDTTFPVTVTVTDNLDGTMSAQATLPQGGITFRNIYAPEGESTPATVTLEKVLTGRDMRAGEFSFVLTDAVTDEVVATAQAPASAAGEPASVTLTTLTYDASDMLDEQGNRLLEKDFAYRLSEVVPQGAAADGVTYDTAVHDVVVHVTDDGEGHLFAAVTTPTPQFQNSYHAQDATYTPVGDKTTEALDTTDLEAVRFTYAVRDADGNVVATGISGANGPISFGSIPVTGTGTFTYTITENVSGAGTGGNGGITYDSTVVTLTLEVSDPGTGSYDVAATYSPDDVGAEFHNVYDGGVASVHLGATKELSGRALKAGEFGFVVTDDVTGAVVGGGTNDADGYVDLGTINYSYYTKAATPDVSPEPGASDATDLPADPQGGEGDSVTPGGATAPGQGTPEPGDDLGAGSVTEQGTDGPGSAVMLGDEDSGDAGAVSQQGVTGDDSSTVAESEPSGADATQAATSGSRGIGLTDLLAPTEAVADDQNAVPYGDGGSFDASQAAGATDVGLHRYTVTEVVPQGATPNDDGTYTFRGVTYDKLSYHVTVEVDDLGNGRISATVTEVVRSDGTPMDLSDGMAPAAVFRNSYATTEPVSVTLEGTKALTGRDASAGEFGFVVRDAAGATVATGTSAAAEDGEAAPISFGTITFAVPGTYDYAVSEVGGGSEKDGVSFDAATFRAQVVVSDNGDGTLSAQVSYPDGPVAFKNAYRVVEPATVRIEGTKALTGRDASAGEFGFVVRDAAGATVATGTSAAAKDGEAAPISFGELTVEAPGEYDYVVSEVNAGQTILEVTYDASTFRVHVSAKDNGHGGIDAAVSYPDGPVAFSNSYRHENPPTPPGPPDGSDDHDKPGTPDNPGTPGNPESPDNPGTPGNPESPDNPGTPNVPGGSNPPSTSVPKTGDATPGTAALAGVAMGGAALAVVGAAVLLRRRRPEV